MSLNNSIPIDLTPKDKLEATEPLRVISKLEWLDWKEKLKSLSKSLVSPTSIPNKAKTALVPGTLLRLSNLNGDLTSKWDIKVALLHFCDPIYIDFKAPDSTSIVRFGSSTELQKCLLLIDEKGLKIKGAEIEATLLEGEQESQYFDKIKEKRKKLANKKVKEA